MDWKLNRKNSVTTGEPETTNTNKKTKMKKSNTSAPVNEASQTDAQNTNPAVESQPQGDGELNINDAAKKADTNTLEGTGEAKKPEPPSQPLGKVTKGGDVLIVPLGNIRIVKGLNIRQDLGDISSLVESIRENGQKVPLRAQKKGDEFFVTDGHRRLKALQILANEPNAPEITAKVIAEPKGVNDEQRIVDMVLTNEGKPLSVLELSEAVKRLLALNNKPADIARKLSFSPAYVSKLQTLLEAPAELIEAIRKGIVNATFVIQIVKKGAEAVAEIISKLKEGSLNDTTDEDVDLQGEKLENTGKAKKSGKITNKDVSGVNSFKEFKAVAVTVDEKRLDKEKKAIFLFVLQLANNQLTKQQLTEFFPQQVDPLDESGEDKQQ